MSGSDQEDRRQAPTQARLARARAEGQVPLSRELTSFAGLAAATLMIMLVGPELLLGLSVRLQHSLIDFTIPPNQALREAGFALAWAAGPLLIVIMVAGSGAVLLQTGGLLNTKSLIPDLLRIDPSRGLKRIFGLTGAVETLKAVAKACILAWAVRRSMSDAFPQSLSAFSWQSGTLLAQLGKNLFHLMLLVLGCQAVIAAVDFSWARWQFARKLRMSNEDVKQEHKEAEGDPRFKARLKQIRLGRARRRMLSKVASATVVITNPTHYAVAITYDRGSQAAPRIVAKGMDDVAARIREAAAIHGVPVVENPPLARALHTLPLDAEIPSEHFKAVAEIIAYIWRLRGQLGATRDAK